MRVHAAALGKSNRQLESEIIRRKAGEVALAHGRERYQKIFRESLVMQRKLRQLTHQIIMAQEEERKEISRELHDEVVQTLVGINVQLSALGKGAANSLNTLRNKIARTQRLVEHSGNADSLAQKELTTAYAKDIDGVKTVTNDIVVKDGRPGMTLGDRIDDASITSQVKYALLTHKSTSALKTKITTTDGVVRVTGDANSAAEKALVTKLASDVRGTKSVNNEMTVKS